MPLSAKEFVKLFDIAHPDWSLVPVGFPKIADIDLTGLDSLEVGTILAAITVWDMSQSDKPEPAKSRVWKSTDGYRFLVQWTNLVLLRLLLQKYFHWLQTSPNSPLHSSKAPLTSSNYKNLKLFDRQAAQVLDAARSSVANLEEGFARPTTSEYLQFLGYSQASLKEVKGDVQRLAQDGVLRSQPGSTLISIGIDLQEWHEYAKKPEPHRGTYRKLEELKGEKLTYEIFVELINKTDYTSRKLVVSLEEKLDRDHKYYQVDQLRLKDKARGRR